ncbi:MAG: L,D-transpeptidase family protein [Solirubrobacterales bacterium]|nr:L,D-transpeptidase family protein [Solirubrobacterales bacterium]
MLAVVLGVAAVAVVLASSRPRLTADPVALARVTLPAGGGQIESVSVVTGPHSTPVPAQLRGNRIWPSGLLPSNRPVSIEVVVKRPVWVSWLTGKRERLQLTLSTPAAQPRAEYMTLAPGAPLEVGFTEPVATYAYGSPGLLVHRTLSAPQASVTLPRSAPAGSIWVAGAPRPWETAAPTVISWFPPGRGTAAVASPAPGTAIAAGTPITLTFSKPVAEALGSHPSPPVSPMTEGAWHTVDSHTIVFRPEGYGYGLGAKVSIGLPTSVHLVGGAATWRVPRGSTLRLQQMLAQLGYLPLSFSASGPAVAPTSQAQEQAAVKPPAGTFSWRYGSVPSSLRSAWSPGAAGEITRGAVMAFENDHGLSADGDAGPKVWTALIAAVMTGRPSSFGYTYVTVDKSSQSLSLWHNGRTVLSTPVNTGIAQAPTASGTFAVFEHLRVTTMSGTNPDGSHYSDPDIQFVSYFNGGDALHAFTRAQYGYPQSLGCVEMALGPAGQVWPYTPIGTLVHVA